MSTHFSNKNEKSLDSRHLKSLLSDQITKNLLNPYSKAQKPKPDRKAYDDYL